MLQFSYLDEAIKKHKNVGIIKGIDNLAFLSVYEDKNGYYTITPRDTMCGIEHDKEYIDISQNPIIYKNGHFKYEKNNTPSVSYEDDEYAF